MLVHKVGTATEETRREISQSKFWTPETPELPEVRLQLELLLPTLPTPDTVLVPALKNPDDGAVEFPNSGPPVYR